MKVVETEPVIPDRNDAPAALRDLAHRIEHGLVEGRGGLFVIVPRGNDYPKVYGFGPLEETGVEPISTLEMAKHWMIINVVRRG